MQSEKIIQNNSNTRLAAHEINANSQNVRQH